jgi:catechol 2,3-dioxygenase-like lactoylglutathione lyase family enzyme
MKPTLTHVALAVRDAAASVAFYERFAGLGVVHERVDDGTRVVWIGERPDHPDFVLVLIEGAAPASAGPSRLLHFGFAVGSRDAVDALAGRARAEGILTAEPKWGGPVVGYYCIVQDPDGQGVEFSYGQSIGRRETEEG